MGGGRIPKGQIQKVVFYIFQKKGIRPLWHNEEWWFFVIDVVEALTGNKRPRKYWNDLKSKLQGDCHVEVSDKNGQLKIQFYS